MDIDRMLQIVEGGVDFLFSDAEEIGSSDISCCVNNCLKQYYGHTNVQPEIYSLVRNAVQNAIAISD